MGSIEVWRNANKRFGRTIVSSCHRSVTTRFRFRHWWGVRWLLHPSSLLVRMTTRNLPQNVNDSVLSLWICGLCWCYSYTLLSPAWFSLLGLAHTYCLLHAATCGLARMILTIREHFEIDHEQQHLISHKLIIWSSVMLCCTLTNWWREILLKACSGYVVFTAPALMFCVEVAEAAMSLHHQIKG